MNKLIKTGILIIILILCVSMVKKGTIVVSQMIFPLEYEENIFRESEENGLSAYQVMGVIYAESKFSAGAHSGIAKGLMQITDETAKEIAGKLGMKYNEDMAYNPEKNIKMGCYYLAYLKELFGNMDTALAAYNAGPGKVKEWLSDERYSSDGVTLYKIPYPETEKYVERVRKLTGIYQKLY